MANPVRYGSLSHPGDTYSFDMFSQAGEAVKAGSVLGPLKAKRVIATGESQSAVFMTTYVDAVDPLARIYDGFYIHSRFGGAPPPETAAMRGGPNARGPAGRPDAAEPARAGDDPDLGDRPDRVRPLRLLGRRAAGQ